VRVRDPGLGLIDAEPLILRGFSAFHRRFTATVNPIDLNLSRCFNHLAKPWRS
jgi:hypothetical protein